MSAEDTLSEIIAMNISKKSAEDALACGQGAVRKNLALKVRGTSMSSDDEDDDDEAEAENIKHEFNDHLALSAQKFWRGKGRTFNSKENSKTGFSSKDRTWSCYNCGNKKHFVAECPYEKREDNGGKLVRKSVTSPSSKSFADKNV